MGGVPWRGRTLVFPVSEAPHGRQLPVWEGDEEEKKVDGDFRPYFQNWVHPRRGKANCVGDERVGGGRQDRERGGRHGRTSNSQAVQVNYGTISGALDFFAQVYRRCSTACKVTE